MAGTMKVEGGDELQKMIMSVGEAGQAIASLALYEGAGVMADAINASISTIRTEEFHYAAVEGVTTRLPSPEEVALVKQGGAGIAKFSKSPDEVLTSIGFKNAGYGEVNGKVKPIPLIANSIRNKFHEKTAVLQKGCEQDQIGSASRYGRKRTITY